MSDQWPNEDDRDLYVVVVPIAMPSWNQLLLMNKWKRMEVRHLIHELTFTSITTGQGCLTRATAELRQPRMQLLRMEYYAEIQPKKSEKSATGKLKFRARKKRRRS